METADIRAGKQAMRPPAIDIRKQGENGQTTVVLCGHWTLLTIGPRLDGIRRELSARARDPDLHWDLCQIDAIDGAAALLLWQAWGNAFPAHLKLQDRHRPLFEKWLDNEHRQGSPGGHVPFSLIGWLSTPSAALFQHLHDAIVILGQVIIEGAYLLLHPARIPWKETSAILYQAGTRALGITGLVGLLIGVVTAYQSSVQLRMLGAEVFVIDILGFSITRELGPLLAAILVAGRSGSAMTAQLGAMRLTQELDAMTTLGLSHIQRLVLPRVAALTIALPLLTIWTDVMAMAGGILSSQLSMGVTYQQFMHRLPEALPVVNLWIGLGKAAVFGALIGMTAGHFGLRVKPNTHSLSMETTKAVVTSITLVIVLDAIFSIVFQDVGFKM